MNRQPARSFKDLVVESVITYSRQKAHLFVLEVYKLSNNFPKSEIYGLTSQLRRAAVSIPANIAEGFKKRGLADKLRFLNIAQGSLSLEECRYYLILVQDLQYGETQKLALLLEEVSKILEAYFNSIEQKKYS
jgi:four helix bundle protein